MFYVYILSLVNKTYYIGYSSNLKMRLLEHTKGNVESTKKFLPCSLVYYSSFISKAKALNFEKYLKSSSGFAFRNKHLI